MQLTEHNSGQYHRVREASESGVRIDDRLYRSSLIVGAHYLESEWPVQSLSGLDEATLAPLLELQPELVVIGIGRSHRMLDITIQRRFVEQGVGIESMTLAAAARTFNILMSENRRALGAFILPRG